MGWSCAAQTGAEVADHLDALRLAARQRARRPVEREVAQPSWLSPPGARPRRIMNRASGSHKCTRNRAGRW
jgi:hypothetical protein